MKYEVKRMTPEFKAMSYAMLILQISLLSLLYWEYVSSKMFVGLYAVLFITSLAIAHQQSEFVDEHRVNI